MVNCERATGESPCAPARSPPLGRNDHAQPSAQSVSPWRVCAARQGAPICPQRAAQDSEICANSIYGPRPQPEIANGLKLPRNAQRHSPRSGVAVGLFGGAEKTSFTASCQRASSTASSRSKPLSGRSGTLAISLLLKSRFAVRHTCQRSADTREPASFLLRDRRPARSRSNRFRHFRA